MREAIKKAIHNTVQDLVNSGVKTSLTEKELKELGIAPRPKSQALGEVGQPPAEKWRHGKDK